MGNLMLLGNKLRIESYDPPRPGVCAYGKPSFLCIKCGKNFLAFKGMQRRGPGLGYCSDHDNTKARPVLEKP